jgi:tetratricopeptide (TPR) repeat protein/transglutaminase-like putative cysteine protease
MHCYHGTWILPFFAIARLYASDVDLEIQLRETKYTVDADGSVKIAMHERWRALTGTGRTELSRIQIPYASSDESVEFRSMKTWKKDGSVVDGDPAAAFDTAASADANTAMFDDTRFKTVLPPNLETGDSVEFEAIRRVATWIKPGDFWLEHSARTDVRVLSEIVVLDLPAGRKIALYEEPGGKVETAAGRRIERWELSNSLARKRSVDNQPPVFMVSSLTSWDQLGQWIHSLNDAASAVTPEIKALAEKLTANQTSEQARITALYAYVATRIRYTAVSFGLGRFQPHSATTVLHNAFGDCKDQSALLTALLTAGGFKTHIVMAHPSIGVAVADVPSPAQFNHEFAAVETKDGLLFLDASIGLVPPGVLQPGVRGRTALLVADHDASVILIPIKTPVPNRIALTLKGKVNAAGAFAGSTRVEFQGVLEGPLRRGFADASESQKEILAKQLSGSEFQNAAISRITSSAVDDLSKPFVVEWQMSDETFLPQSRRAVRIGTASNLGQMTALRSLPKPEKPLPMDAVEFASDMDLVIDPNLTIVNGMPVHKKAPFGSLDSEFTYENRHQKFAFSMKFNGTPIMPEDWPSLLDFLGSAQSDQALNFTLERGPGPLASPYSKAMQEGVIAYQGKDYKAAKEAYLKATRLDPNSKNAWNDLGRACQALREYSEAEKAYRKQIEVNPRDLYAYNNLGVTLRLMKRQDEAIASFRKQIEISPNDRYAHDNLGISLAALKRYPEALKEEEIAVSLTPEDVNKLMRLGRMQLRTGHPDQARKTFDEMLALPHDAMLENNVAFDLGDMGIALENDWRLISGALAAESKLTCRPEKPESNEKCNAQMNRLAIMLDTAGWVLYRQGKIEAAEPYLRSAYAISPRVAMGLHTTVILAKLGRTQEAAKRFIEAQSRRDFANADARETEEARSAVGSALNSLGDASAKGNRVQVTVLVDESGKVLEASGGSEALAAAKKLTLPLIAWPDCKLVSVRTVELTKDGESWKLIQSFVVKPAQDVEQ